MTVEETILFFVLVAYYLVRFSREEESIDLSPSQFAGSIGVEALASRTATA